MRLDDFLAQNPLPDDAGAVGDGKGGSVADSVTIAGRFVGATDDEVRVLLGSAVACVPRVSVRGIDRDPAPPAVEPTSVWVRVQVDAGAPVRMETTTPAGALAGAGLRPLVAAEPTMAPRYRVPAPASLISNRWAGWVGGVDPFGSPLYANNAALAGWPPTHDTAYETRIDCATPCTIETAVPGNAGADAGVQADTVMDHMVDTQTDTRQDVSGIWA